MPLYDVHFTIKGNWQIFADSEQDAIRMSNEIHERFKKDDLEYTLNTETTFEADDALVIGEDE